MIKIKTLFRLFSACLILFILQSCSDSTGNGDNTDKNTLAYLVSSTKADNENIIMDTAKAWAIGGQKTYLEDSAYPYSIIFHQILGSWNFQYFETNSLDDNPDDLNKFFKKDYNAWIMFDGNLRRFRHPGNQADVWGRVAFRTNTKLYISKPIKVRGKNHPTVYLDNIIQIDLSNPMEPGFTWIDQDGTPGSTYFEALADFQNYLVSATMTRDRYFKFYDLSNVIYNIRDVLPPPTLKYGTDHVIIVMGIDKDYWGYFVSARQFTVE